MHLRIRLALVSLAAATSLAATAQQPQRTLWPADKILASSRSSFDLKNRNGEVVQTFQKEAVQRAANVTQRLAAAYGIAPPPLFVEPAAQPNAFATVDSKDGHPFMAINTAMLNLAGDNEEMLAVVMGHELGHVIARHPVVGYQRALGIAAIGTLLGGLVDLDRARHGKSVGMGRVLGDAGAGLVNAKFSRDQEREADRLGLTAMAKAGYDPGVGPRFWQRMAAAGGGGSGIWTDSHPSNDERSANLSALARELAPIYAAANRRSNDTTAASVTALPLTKPPAGGGITTAAIAAAAASWHAPILQAKEEPPGDGYPVSRYFSMEPTPQEVADGAPYAKARTVYTSKAYAQAAPLVQELVQAGDERAMVMAAFLTKEGRGVPMNAPDAQALLERAAKLGFGRAMTLLGSAYQSGELGSKDERKALEYWVMGDARGDPVAHTRLAMAIAAGYGGLAKQPDLARSMAKQAADAGEENGKALLGAMMRDGFGGATDVQGGLALLGETAPRVSWAALQLGQTYEQGKVVPTDKARARMYYSTAAQAGNLTAAQRLKALSP